MRKASTLIGLTLVALGSGARAQDAPASTAPAPATPAATDAFPPASAPPPSPGIVAPVPDAPPLGRTRPRLEIGLSFLPMGAGKITTPIGSMETTGDALFAYGFGLAASYRVFEGIYLGVAPQIVYNVNYKVNPSELGPLATTHEVDLLARLAYEFALVDGITPYLEVLPGYSTISLSGGSAKGLVVAFGGGLALEMSDKIFINMGVGYQVGAQTVSQSGMSLDNKTSYLRVALGGGVRF